MVRAAAALVAQRPGVYAGVVLVIDRHAHGALHIEGRIGRIVRQLARHAVRLQVAFADDQQAHLVAQLVKARAVRIVAGAYGVYVHALHLGQFTPEMLLGHGAALLQAVLVPVHAKEREPPAVHVQHAALYLYGLEAYAAAFKVAFAAVGIDERRRERIERGRFGRPQPDPPGLQHDSRRGGGGTAVGAVSGAGLNGADSLGDARALSVIEPHAHPGVGIASRAAHAHVALHAAGLHARVRAHLRLDIEYVPFRLGYEPHVAVYARQIPVVLVLQVGGIRKAHHLQRHEVAAGPYKVGYVKLGGQLAVLRIAHGPAVDPQVVGRLHALKAQIGAPSLKALGQVELAPVAAGGVLRRYMGRIGHERRARAGLHERRARVVRLERIGHVGIYRLAVALDLPVGGHGYIAKAGVVVIHAEEVVHLLRRVIEPEAVRAVQGTHVARSAHAARSGVALGSERAPARMRLHAVYGKHLGILKFAADMKVLAVVQHDMTLL